MVDNTPFNSYSSMWMFIKILRFTEITFPSIASTHMVPAMGEGPAVHPGQFVGASAELAINATN